MITKNKAYFLLIFAIFLFSCDQKNMVDQQPSTSIENRDWMRFINNKSDSLKTLYSTEAIVVFENGRSLESSQSVVDHLLGENMKIRSIATDTIILANNKRRIEYEMGEFEQNSERYKQIIIWENSDTSRTRVFEYSARKSLQKLDVEALNESRERWISLCNKHDASTLIEKMYTDNTIYYNHKPLIRGKETLMGEYSYMNRENYELVLEPIIIEQVNEKEIFEIGQCVGSYKGKYILVWRKNNVGEWKIFIDSNI